MAIVLNCRNGSLAGQTLEFNEPVITLGRKATNLVRFTTDQEPRVSNSHCEIVQNDGAWFVRDKDSANGTFLDGQRIKTPARLHNGSVVRLSDTGPELVVTLPDESEMTMMDARVPRDEIGATVVMGDGDAAQAAANRPTQPPPPKDGIGMNTLQMKLDQAAFEVRKEYGSRMKSVYIAVAVVLVLAIGAIAWVKISGDQRLKEIQDQSIAELTKSKQDAENRFNEIQKNADTSAQTKVDQMTQLYDEKTRSLEKLAAEAKKAGVDSQAMNQEMVRNRAALQELQGHINDLSATVNAFVNFKGKYSKCVYSLVLRFTEGGEVKHSFVGSAFSLSSNPGVLGTTARTVESIAPLLEDKTYKLVAQCDGDALYSYFVTKTYTPPDFNADAKSAGKDVALLELDLHALSKDGTLGNELPLPEALKPAGDDELDQVVSGMNVAVFGFSDQDRAKLEGETPMTGVATLLTNIVDGTYSFGGAAAAGRDFGLLKHNCAVTKGFAGAPVVNTKYHVVGVQSGMIASARAGGQNAAQNSAYAVSIKTMQELLHAQFPQVK